MAMLELIEPAPDWMRALAMALTRPPGVPERRAGDDPWAPTGTVERPRRISDDLAWLRQAVDEPDTHGLQELRDTAAVAAWATDESARERLSRLERREVLGAAGFLLHEPVAELTDA
jgi:hypothetical protein